MKKNIKRRHHYVWQYYLKSFCHNQNFIYCLIKNEVKNIHTKYIAVEKDLYRLRELTADEIKFILYIFNDELDPFKNQSNTQWVEIFTLVFDIKTSFPTGQIPREIVNTISELEHNLIENLHMDIENKGIFFIDLLKNRNASFFDNEEDKANFLFYILVQYCRTTKMKESFSKIESKGHLDFEKAWNIIVFIIATNVSINLLSEKEAWELLLLKNQCNIPFITSDQPVINLYGSSDKEINKRLNHDDFELYYPISPSISVILKLKNKQYYDYSRIDNILVEQLNKKIYENCNMQAFSNSHDYLESLVINDSFK